MFDCIFVLQFNDMPKFTVNEFRKKYSDDAACLDKVFKLRYGKLEACPECQCKAEFRRITTRRCYQCKHCYAQFYPTAGTPLEKTTTPLSDWFYVIYLFTTTRNGVAAKEIERQLGCTYKTAWRMGHCIRALISGMDIEMLNGFVDMDETYVGSSSKNWSKEKRKAAKQDTYIRKGKEVMRARNLGTKKPVFAMKQRNGSVIAYSIPTITKETVFSCIQQHVSKDAIVSTDESSLYTYLNRDLGMKHGTVKHKNDEYRNGSFCTNSVEGFFSQLKRTIYGTHISVSQKYIQNYISEVTFRQNNRNHPEGMFEAMIQQFKPITL